MWKYALLGGLLALHVAGVLAYHAPDAQDFAVLNGGHPYGKEQWREAHAFVRREMRKGDVVLLHAPFLRMTWEFYDQDQRVPVEPLPTLDLPCDRRMTPAEILQAVPAIQDAKQVFLVSSHEATEERDDYLNAVSEAVSREWGLFQLSQFDLPRQWGIRIFRFARE